jgi:hypothetical protein
VRHSRGLDFPQLPKNSENLQKIKHSEWFWEYARLTLYQGTGRSVRWLARSTLSNTEVAESVRPIQLRPHHFFMLFRHHRTSSTLVNERRSGNAGALCTVWCNNEQWWGTAEGAGCVANAPTPLQHQASVNTLQQSSVARKIIGCSQKLCASRLDRVACLKKFMTSI